MARLRLAALGRLSEGLEKPMLGFERLAILGLAKLRVGWLGRAKAWLVLVGLPNWL